MVEKDPQQEQGDLEYIKYILYTSVRTPATLYIIMLRITTYLFKSAVLTECLCEPSAVCVRASQRFTSRWGAQQGVGTD